jgi:O-antigen ligase
MRIRRASASGWILVTPVAGLMTAGVLKELPVLSRSPLDLTALFTALCAAQVGLRLWGDRGIPRSTTIVFLLFAMLSVGLLKATATDYSTTKAVHLFGSTAVGCIAITLVVRTEEAMRRLFSLVAAVGVVAAVVALARRSSILTHSWSRLAVSEGGNPLTLGRAAAIAIVLIVVDLIVDRRVESSRLRLLALVPAVIALLLSVSQGPIGFAAIAIVIVVLTSAGRRRSSRRMLLVAAAIGVTGLIALSSAAADRSHALFETSEAGRLGVYVRTVGEIGDHPWGVGIGNFGSVVDVPWRIGDAGRDYPHNLWLEVAIEEGLLVALCVGAVCYWGVKKAWRVRQRSAAFSQLFAALVFFLLNACVSGDLNDNRPLLMLLSLSLGASELRQRPTIEVPAPASCDERRPRVLSFRQPAAHRRRVRIRRRDASARGAAPP